MGRPKLLLPWGGTTVVGHLVGLWQKLEASQLAVVGAGDDPALDAELARLSPHSRKIVNPLPELGMFSSIQAAARWDGWDPGLTHWAIVLGDQPHLKESLLRGLLGLARDLPDSVCQPARRGKPRHPVLLPKKLFAELAASPAPHLGEFLRGRQIALFESDEPGLDLDLDRPEDYEAALRLAAAQPNG